jgi:bifunctional non-homologous end joining protein LigD
MGGLPKYAPMLAVLGELPAKDEGWAFEMKWDGVRAIAYLERGQRLLSRNDKDITVAYPELGGLAEAVGGPVVLDGEIVAFDKDGRPSFKALQPRIHQRRPTRIQALANSTPVTYMLFDVLHLGEEPLISRPYTERREILEGLGLSGPRWETPPPHPGSGTEAFAESKRLGLEGIVAKQTDSPYRPGRRHRSWTKVKNFKTQEVVIVGWKSGEGRRAGTIGALMLGIHDDTGRLVYVGNVGTGFTEEMLADLAQRLRPLEQAESPIQGEIPREDSSGVHWVAPQLVGEVSFAEWTGEGRLRHPSWRGLRADKDPGEVVREE